ncbi:hypothetical protein lerEdw1_011560 [Lerista edwardsae]|nr:hypothetical protein lerEdw1_011560 [Lerista edwardsae]
MSCFSCNRRRRRLAGDGAAGEEARKEKGLDPVVGDGCPLQSQQCPVEPQPETAAAARIGEPEGHTVTTALARSPPAGTPGPEATLLAPLPVLPLLWPPPELMVFVRELESAREFQAHHLQERRKDLRSCQDCLRTLKAMRERLQAAKSRLRKAEAKLGIPVPPQELDPEEEEEESDAGGEQPPTPPAEAPEETLAAA